MTDYYPDGQLKTESMFSNDKLTYKIRHIYGGAVTDRTKLERFKNPQALEDYGLRLTEAEAMQAALYAISEAAHAAEDLPTLFQRIHQIIAGLDVIIGVPKDWWHNHPNAVLC